MFSICKNYTYERQDTLSLINEGFLKIFLNLKSFDEQKGNFEAWAKKIMTNNCIDYTRKESGRMKVLDMEDSPQAMNIPEKEKKDIENEVIEMIRKLPKNTQNIFSLHVFKGYSHKEISQMMNITESTSRWHIMEARKNLKKDVQKIF